MLGKEANMTVSKAQWKSILKETNGLKEQLHIRSFIPEDELKSYRFQLMDSLRGFLEQGTLHLGMKIFVDQERRIDLNEHLIQNIPALGVDPADWGEQVFEGKRFGIILNNLEKHSNGLTELMATNAKGLLEEAGMPLNGLALLFFMGNYGFTPFGIHKENYGEEGFLIHLGPGAKTFYTWKTDEYLAMTKGAITYPVTQELLAKATSYTMMPGDAFFVPSTIFHVAETNEFSFSIVLDYLNSSPLEFKKKLLQTVDFENTKASDKTLPIPFPIDIETAYKGLKESISLDQEMRESFKIYCQRLESNGGFEAKTVSVQPSSFLSSPFTGAKPFKILYSMLSDERYMVASRGHESKFSLNQNCIDLIDILNQYQIVSISFENLADYGDDGMQFLGFLSSTGAISNVKDAT